MTNNPFSAFSEKSMTRATKRKVAQKQKREQTKKEKALDERSKLSAKYRRETKAYRDKILKSPRGIPLSILISELQKYGIHEADAMIEHMQKQDWLINADREIRYLALGMIDEKIMKLRISVGLEPFDDPLPGEPLNAFLIIKKILKVR